MGLTIDHKKMNTEPEKIQPPNRCPKCDNPIKVVPSGISKRTGKPYSSFLSCTNRDCDYTARLTDKPQNTGEQMIMEGINNIIVSQKEIWKLLATIQNRVEDIYNNLDRK